MRTGNATKEKAVKTHKYMRRSARDEDVFPVKERPRRLQIADRADCAD